MNAVSMKDFFFSISPLYYPDALLAVMSSTI